MFESATGWSALGAVLVGLVGLGCSSPQVPLIVLVSFDTTRADALGCYQDVSHWGLDLPAATRPVPRTPVVDGLAASGVRHAWALAHAPTTLASHASLMSGRDTRRARVPRNGFAVPVDVPLLAPRLKQAGWDTIGVVGASVLAADMGLSRGFRIYDDDVTQKVRRRYEHTADQVVDRVFAAVDSRTRWSGLHDDPLFLFVHFFDAHSPWQSAPAEVVAPFLAQDPSYEGAVDGSSASMDWLVRTTKQGRVGTRDRRRARALYLAEVAAMDRALGRLLDGLDERVPASDRLLVVVGDHGESLDQPQVRPYGHGLDVDLVATHVPFIVQGTGRWASATPAGTVLSQPVGLMDLAPSLASLAGLSADPSASGLDLSRAWQGAVLPDRPLFAEATKPLEVEKSPDWNNLHKERAVVSVDAVLTEAPWEGDGSPKLFTLAPGQPVLEDEVRKAALKEQIDGWDRRAPAYQDPAMSAETRAALVALGYLEP